jgi:penicillin amidase
MSTSPSADTGASPSAFARLASFPRSGLQLQSPVRVRWNRHLVPYIEADSDRDLAYTLGLVQAHLRGAQLAMAKRLVYGRLCEMVGPLAIGIDHALRIIGLDRAVVDMERALPPLTREWLTAFVEGLNDWQSLSPQRPAEFRWLGLEWERWTIADVLTLSRLAGADLSWIAFIPLLKARGSSGYETLWRRVLESGSADGVDDSGGSDSILSQLLASFSRSGSNCCAVSARRSASGSALLEADPHLGLMLPNFWLAAGWFSPGYRAVGLMPVGMPTLAIGRSQHLAWGGTNLHAASSDLVDVSQLPADQIETREVLLRTRLGPTLKRSVRTTPQGPILSDAPPFATGDRRPVALRWTGHRVSDEISALLRGSQARSAGEYREALASFGVSGMNMLCADARGDIDHVLAVKLPRRSGWPACDPVLSPEAADAAWSSFVESPDFPAGSAPLDGVLASANNRPTSVMPVPVSWLFSDDDRVQRLHALLAAVPKLSVDDLKQLQTDTRSPKAHAIAQALAAWLSIDAPGESALHSALSNWNGDYGAESTGAAAFELFLGQLVPALHGKAKAADVPELYTHWSTLTHHILPDLQALPVPLRQSLFADTAQRAARLWRKWPRWGDLHTIRAGHLLSRVPGLTRFWRVTEWPAGGSRETVMKAAHGLVESPRPATYGSQARFVADLADPDATEFALVGGQDGTYGSPCFADQIPLWREHRYVRLPMSEAGIAAEFTEVLYLPAAAPSRAD